MSGRIQNAQKIEQKIEERLRRYPAILTEYYYSMTDNTAATKNAYIRYITDYFDYLVDNGYDIKDNSIFSNMKIGEINMYINHIRYSKATENHTENKESIRRTRMDGVKSFYSYLVNAGMIQQNPCNKIKLPKLNQEHNVISMTENEIQFVKRKIIESNDRWSTRDLLIFTLGCRTGLRVTALCEIDINDIDFNENRITVVEKGNKPRQLCLGSDTMRLIKKWVDERGIIPGCDALFISNRNTRISQRTVQRMIAKYTADLDKHITPHKMRSTCGTLLYEKTGNIYLVANQLGHKNIATTTIYTGISERKKRETANMLDLI